MSIKKILYRSIVWRGLFYLTVFLLNVFIARHFGAAQSGNVYYLINIFSLIILFSGFSIESGITYFTAKNEIDSGKLLSFSVAWSVVTGMIALAVFYYFLQPYYQLPGNVLLFAVVTFIGGNHLQIYSTAFFYAKNNFVFPNLVNVIINIALILLIPFHSWLPEGFNSDSSYFYLYFGAYLLQGIILATAVWILYDKSGKLKLITREECKKLFAYCGMAYGSNIVFFFLYRIDYWFVKHYCSGADLGNYIQVSKLGQLFFVLPTILASAIFPLTASGKREVVKELLTLLSRSLLWAYMLICLLLTLFGNRIFLFVFGDTYSKMYPAFLFLIPGILFLSMLYTLTAYYAGKNRIWVNIKGALIAFIFVIAGDYLLIPKFGINAASLVSSIGYFVYLMYVLNIFKKEYHVGFKNFFIIKKNDFALLYKTLMQQNKNVDGK